MLVSVCVHGWVSKEMISCSASLVGLSGEVTLCELLVSGLCAKNGQRAVPMWTHMNLHEDARLKVGVEKDNGHWSVKSKTQSRRVRQLGRETLERRVSNCQKAARGQWRWWQSRDWDLSGETSQHFCNCLGFLQSSYDSHVYTCTECQRCCQPRFLTVFQYQIDVLCFFPSFLCFLLF